jgi:hypothetical protein
MGALRRLSPISRSFGYDRGTQSVARYYIDQFIAAHAADVRGCVLEVGDPTYTRRCGAGRVTESDVLHAVPGNPAATIVADLTREDSLSPAKYNCIIMTQTLQVIYDCATALKHAERALRPGGVLLATMSGISQISRYDMDRWGEFWRFTTLSARRLFEQCFPAEGVCVEGYGNVLAAIAFLHGLASHELQPEELTYHDRDYEVIIGVRAQKTLH